MPTPKIKDETFCHELKIEHIPGKGFSLRIKSRIGADAYEDEELMPSLPIAILGAMSTYTILMESGSRPNK